MSVLNILPPELSEQPGGFSWGKVVVNSRPCLMPAASPSLLRTSVRFRTSWRQRWNLDLEWSQGLWLGGLTAAE